MEKLEAIISSLTDFLSYKIIDTETIHVTVATFLVLTSMLIVATFVLKIINRLLTAKLPEEDRNKFISIFSFLRYFFYILIIFVVLNASGVNLTVFLTASTALFVGLGFALQYLFQDIISGILIILDQSLHVGDIIEIDGKVGRVFEIRLRTTRAVTKDDKVIVAPNHLFLTNSIYNYTQNHNTTRELIQVGVAHGSDVTLVSNLLEQAAADHTKVLKKPKPFVTFDDFGQSALLFSVHFFIDDSFLDIEIKSDIRYQIDKAFRENQVTIPFPQRDIHGSSQTPDLLRLEYTVIPENDFGIRTNRYRALFNVPIKLSEKNFLVTGMEYNRYEFEIERDLPFQFNNLERLHIIDLNLGYSFMMNPDWRVVTLLTPRIASNIERGLDNNDLRLNASLVFWRERKDLEKPDRLILGLSFK